MSNTTSQHAMDVEWDSHKEELTRLYMAEKKSLSKVMQLMVDRHQFVAKKNQYEKYLHHKWKLNKKTNSKTWMAIAPIIQDLERRGRHYELWIDNEKKSIQTIHRQIRRHTSRNQNTLETVNSTKLPQGVVIRQIYAPVKPQTAVDIPFLSLEQELANMHIHQSRRMLRSPRSSSAAETAISNQVVSASGISKSLQVVALDQLSRNSPFNINEQKFAPNVFTSINHRQLLCSLANNSAGLCKSHFYRVDQFLRDDLYQVLSGPTHHTKSHSAVRAIAKRLFEIAVMNGQTDIVSFLLEKPELRIDPNRIVNQDYINQDYINQDCISQYLWHLPISIAVLAQRKDLIEILLKHKADPNLASPWGTGIMDIFAMGGHSGDKASEILTMDSRLYGSNLDLEIFDLLMKYGAKMSDYTFQNLVQHDKTGRLVAAALSRAVPSEWKNWGSQYIFDIFEFHAHEIQLQTLDLMRRCGVDLEIRRNGKFVSDGRCHLNSRCEETLVDIVAGHGELTMLEIFLAHGVSFTHRTLFSAVQSGREQVVRWVLNQSLPVGCGTECWDSVMAKAVSKKDVQIIELISSRCPSMTGRCYRTMEAASDSGNWELFHLLRNSLLQIEATEEQQPRRTSDRRLLDMLRSALCHALRQGKDSLALELLDAEVHRFLPNEMDLLRDAFITALRFQNPQTVNKMLHLDMTWSRSDRRKESKDSELSYAVRWGNATVTQSIINSGVGLDGPDSLNAMLIAIIKKDSDMLDILLNAGVSINLRFSDNFSSTKYQPRTALEAAVCTHDLNMVEQVLQAGADPHDSRALFRSFEHGRMMFDSLLQRHKLVYPGGHKGWGGHILMSIIAACDLQSFKELIHAGADASELIKDFQEIFPNTSSNDGSDQSLEELDRGSEGSYRRMDNSGAMTHRTSDWTRYETCMNFGGKMSAFGYAIAKSAHVGIDFAEYLLQSKETTGYTPETIVSEVAMYTGLQRQTAMLVAIQSGEIPVIELLIRHKADINFPPNLNVKRTPLQQAVDRGDLEIIRLLLKYGADVNGPAAQRRGATALQFAAIRGYIRSALLLLEHGADVHPVVSSLQGRTALEGAAEYGRLDTVALLLQHYGRYEAKYEKEFASAIRYAEDNGFDYIADLLREHQADSDLFDTFVNFESSEVDENTS